METNENLMKAFAGESQANRRYLAFAKKAEEEGFKNIARLFRAAARAETIHAHNHLRTVGEVKSTKENIQAAINGENYEFTKMYPGFIEKAKSEGSEDARRSFDWANQVEKIHHDLYEKALENLGQGKDIESKDYYVCQTCGNTVEGSPPESCPICGFPKSQFKKIE
ncbi:MAG: rubrerythrin family protein [Candidatus Aenigmarchaeota archaeon]|nr:rubrerythrin family protein [Candidatus Aenigmarchaeota archaeon]NIQ18067.1 rubrerythrin family protein [Candidatus Aenigmarchaeota archaeon]